MTVSSNIFPINAIKENRVAFSSTVHIAERITFRESVCHKARRKYFASERRIWQKIARKLFVIVTSPRIVANHGSACSRCVAGS